MDPSKHWELNEIFYKHFAFSKKILEPNKRMVENDMLQVFFIWKQLEADHAYNWYK